MTDRNIIEALEDQPNWKALYIRATDGIEDTITGLREIEARCEHLIQRVMMYRKDLEALQLDLDTQAPNA